MTTARILTQQELYEFIQRKSPRSFSQCFQWAAELIAHGYQPHFNKIDFQKLYAELSKTLGPIALLQICKNGIFRNITFEKCESVGNIYDATFIDCKFINSTISDFRETSFTNCTFEASQFVSSRVIDCTFINTTISNCHFFKARLNRATLKDTCVMGCEILSSTELFFISGLNKDDYQKNIINKNTLLNGTSWDEIHFNHSKIPNAPCIVMLYCIAEGVTAADHMIKLLEGKYSKKSKNINIVLVAPEVGLKHFIFTQINCISGIILPGGFDVPDDNKDVRKQFELALVELAIKHKIPTLGICRGHQLIGQYFGGTIQSVSRHNHTKNTIIVDEKDSQIYERLEEKYEKFTRLQQGGKMVLTKLTKDSNGRFQYYSTCKHNQAVFFTPAQLDNASCVKIVAKSSDDTIEAMEVNSHIITFQHHNESFLDYHQDKGKVAKALIKIYLKKVQAFHQEMQALNAIQSTHETLRL